MQRGRASLDDSTRRSGAPLGAPRPTALLLEETDGRVLGNALGAAPPVGGSVQGQSGGGT